MTRNLIVIYNENDVTLLYANGITFYKRNIEMFKTCKEVSEVLRLAGYVEPHGRCNPEDVMVVTEYSGGLLIFCSDEEN